MAGYEDTRKKIIETLMGRPIGEEIQPENHQDYALNMLNYIRSLELIANGPLIGIATPTTQPVQPNDARACYLAGVAQDRTVTFQNFRNYLGQPIQITNGEMEACLVILIWDTQYWSAETVPTSIISQADQAYYYYNLTIRKTYPSVAAMNADVNNPIGNDGKYIKVGDIVTVVNSTTPSENGYYSYEGSENGWLLQSGFSFEIVQTTGTDINKTMSQKAVTDELTELESKVEINSLVTTNNSDVFSLNARYSKGTGTYVEGGSYYTTDYLPLSKMKGLEIKYTFPSNASVNKFTLFSEDKEFVGYNSSIDSIIIDNILTDYPSAYYIRLSCILSDFASLEVKQSNIKLFEQISQNKEKITDLTKTFATTTELLLNYQYYSDGLLQEYWGRLAINGYIPISGEQAVSAKNKEDSDCYCVVRYYTNDLTHLGTAYTEESKFCTIAIVINDGHVITKEDILGLKIKINETTYNVVGTSLLAEQHDYTDELCLSYFLSSNPLAAFTDIAYYRKEDGIKVSAGNYISTLMLPIAQLRNIHLAYEYSSDLANKVSVFNEDRNYIGNTEITDINLIKDEYPTACYVVFSILKRNIHTLTSWFDKLPLDGEDTTNYVPILAAKIFRRVGCIGDSYTAGFIKLTSEGLPNNTYPLWSWVHYMKNLTGETWENWGKGGSTAKSWIEGAANLSQVTAEGNKCQAYVIGLMINDQNSGNPYYTPVGVISDIGTDNNTYFAYYYKLIKKCVEVNSSAKIFCNTCPKSGTSFANYNQAVRDIVAYCHDVEGLNVYLCDLSSDKYMTEEFYGNSIFVDDFIQGHYSPICYEFMAECYLKVMSNVIVENLKEFQDVFLIPYDEA